jgi:hypothetical protein
MYEKFILTDFEDKNKWGLPGYFEVLCDNDSINGKMHRQMLNFDTISLKLSFSGMTKDCYAIFDEGKFHSLRFSFYNRTTKVELWIIYEDINNENHLELSQVLCHYNKGNSILTTKLFTRLDENALKIYMMSAQEDIQGQEMRDLLPELHIEGVYDFQSEDFNRRWTLASMLVV